MDAIVKPGPEPVRRGEAVEAARGTDPKETDGRRLRRIEELPKEVGVMLLSVGAVGFVLPAMAGTPAILAGGLVLWPRTFGKLERWIERRYPVMHREGMRQVARYLDDLERRFPDATRA